MKKFSDYLNVVNEATGPMDEALKIMNELNKNFKVFGEALKKNEGC